MPSEANTHVQEVWDEATCRKRSRSQPRDYWGNTHPFPGYIGSPCSAYPPYGWQNDGSYIPFPQVHPDYKIVVVPTWGWRIMRKDDTGPYQGNLSLVQRHC